MEGKTIDKELIDLALKCCPNPGKPMKSAKGASINRGDILKEAYKYGETLLQLAENKTGSKI